MTFEEIQKIYSTIAESDARSAARMDRLEQGLDRLEQQQQVQREDIQALIRLANTLLKISEEEASQRKQLEKREAEERKQLEKKLAEEREKMAKRVEGLEGKVDGIEEMTKILRLILEGKLRWPEDPRPEKK